MSQAHSCGLHIRQLHMHAHSLFQVTATFAFSASLSCDKTLASDVHTASLFIVASDIIMIV